MGFSFVVQTSLAEKEDVNAHCGISVTPKIQIAAHTHIKTRGQCNEMELIYCKVRVLGNTVNRKW